jgi:lipoprotein-releasing system permease protein
VKLELFVALRYLKARRKQAVVSVVTAISILGVMAGVAALIIALSLNAGFQSEYEEKILSVTSHVNVMGPGGRAVDDYEGLAARLSGVSSVTEVNPVVYGQALLQSNGREEPAILKGIISDPAVLEKSVPGLVEGSIENFANIEGQFPPLILGKELADALVVSEGEFVRAIGLEGALSPLGRMPRLQTFRIAAVFESGLWEYDSKWALTPLGPAQKFAGINSFQASNIELLISDIYAASEVAERIKDEFGPMVSTSTWIELNKPLFSALKLEKLAMFLAISLIVFVASLNIVSTLILMVMEKGRDIAVMAAMGGDSRFTTRLFMLQGLIIGVTGTIMGDILGIVTAWYLNAFQVIKLEPQVYSIPFVPFHLSWSDVAVVSVVAVLISLVATVYPAWAAAKLNPVEALRYE